MPESIKIGGEPKPSKTPKPSGPEARKRKKKHPRSQSPVGVKHIILFLLAAGAILYLILGLTRGWF